MNTNPNSVKLAIAVVAKIAAPKAEQPIVEPKPAFDIPEGYKLVPDVPVFEQKAAYVGDLPKAVKASNKVNVTFRYERVNGYTTPVVMVVELPGETVELEFHRTHLTRVVERITAARNAVTA